MGKKQNKIESNIKSNVCIIPKQNVRSFPFAKIFCVFAPALIALASYYAYITLTTPPPLPKLDPNYYWGLYPMNSKQDLSIRPFSIEFSDVMINDLKERLLHRRTFIPPLDDIGFEYGFNTKFLTRVLDYWQKSYDFKNREKFFNKYNHFVTNIQGLDIHFMHVKPKVTTGVTVVPLLMLHGWPGSIREFYDVIPKLTTQRQGQKFVFEIVAPSLPGYGFSQGASRPGLNALHVAVIMRNLMRRIGHDRFYIQGGDWGHTIGSNMATLFTENVLGFHTNCPILLFNKLATVYTMIGALWPSLLEPQAELQSRMYPLSEKISFILEEAGYLHLQATKPDTIGVALTDSPAGLAAYILEKFSTWTNPAYKQAGDGNLLAKFSLTHLLDNIMVYWSTNSITTSMRFYAENLGKRLHNMDEIPTKVPTWGIKFKHEILYQPDVILRLKYKNYLHSTVVEDGGHFAALEYSDMMADDIFEAVSTFIQFHEAAKKPKHRSPNPNSNRPITVYDFTATDINGEDVKLKKYKGYTLIIINVASECGFTDINYEQLNQLYDKYYSKGLRILAFPCNQFGAQEPGTSSEILEFIKGKGVKFDVFEKIDVNGDDAHPLWNFLKDSQGGSITNFIKWNFSKFIINKHGIPVERFAPTTNPIDLEPHLIKYL